jgi:hypothetical protein
MNRTLAAATLVLLGIACQKAPEQSNAQNLPLKTAPSPPAAPAPPSAPTQPPEPQAPQPPNPGAPGGLPEDRTAVTEPKGPIDPKSAEGAAQVVQHYGALIEQKRFAEAEKLWGDSTAATRMTAQLKSYSEAHLQIGKPKDMEGAAGSIYITVPAVLYGAINAKSVHRSGDVILRRVNDVPGSTQAERRWHIDRIDWSDAS